MCARTIRLNSLISNVPLGVKFNVTIYKLLNYANVALLCKRLRSRFRNLCKHFSVQVRKERKVNAQLAPRISPILFPSDWPNLY